jgi:hypothetical protein
MGCITDLGIASWQQEVGLTPATGEYAELLNKLSDAAVEAIKIIELERSGIRDGDGYWHGCGVIHEITNNLIGLCQQILASLRGKRGEPVHEWTIDAEQESCVGRIVLHLAKHHVPGDYGDCSINDPIVSIVDGGGSAAEFLRAIADMDMSRAAGIAADMKPMRPQATEVSERDIPLNESRQPQGIDDFDFDKAGDYHFGVCPVCHKTDGYANAGRSHRFYCKEHKKSWLVGSNLFSSWRFETLGEQKQKWDEIGLSDFEDVEPYMGPPGFWNAYHKSFPF